MQTTTSKYTTLPRMLHLILRSTGTTSTGTRRHPSAFQVCRKKVILPDPDEIVLGKETINVISGKATGITAPVPALQNAVHSVGYLFIVPVSQSHCNIKKDACKVMKPKCGSLGPHGLYPGQDFCACMELKIPNYARAGVSWVMEA